MIRRLQAERIPKELRIEGREVSIRRLGDGDGFLGHEDFTELSL